MIDNRLLQDGEDENEDVTTLAPTIAPTAAPTKSPLPRSNASTFGFVLVFLLCVVVIFVGWRTLKYWRRRREQRLLDIRSAQANRVLGDMQMVPNDDLDDHGLI